MYNMIRLSSLQDSILKKASNHPNNCFFVPNNDSPEEQVFWKQLALQQFERVLYLSSHESYDYHFEPNDMLSMSLDDSVQYIPNCRHMTMSSLNPPTLPLSAYFPF